MMRGLGSRATRCVTPATVRWVSSFGGRGTPSPGSSSALLHGLQLQTPRYPVARQNSTATRDGSQNSLKDHHTVKPSDIQPRDTTRGSTVGVDGARKDTSDNSNDKDIFNGIRSHGFFRHILSRVEREMSSVKSSSESYSSNVVNECIRPLLQLTDKAFTVKELHQLIPKFNPEILINTIKTGASQRALHLFYSSTYGTVLDWTAEDFLRRRYESIHLSWEPMEVVGKRFGWGPNVMSSSDVLLYFSMFDDLVEFARLEIVGGKPKALPIRNPQELARRGGIPLSQLLIRRKSDEETEPSLTESIRLMGTPSLVSPSKSKNMSRRSHTKDSVLGVFDAIESNADSLRSVEANEGERLNKAADNAAPTRQAHHPAGRVIREFSIGKIDASTETQHSMSSAQESVETARNEKFNQYEYDSLCGAYHRRKVEISLLRRRISNIGSSDQAALLQDRLANARKELSLIGDQLKQMTILKQQSSSTTMSSRVASPRFQDIQETDSTPPKNDNAAAEDIMEEIDVTIDETENNDAEFEEVTAEDEELSSKGTTQAIQEAKQLEKDSAAAELAAWAVREFEEDEIEQHQLVSRNCCRGVKVVVEEHEDEDTMEELERAEEELEIEAQTTPTAATVTEANEESDATDTIAELNSYDDDVEEGAEPEEVVAVTESDCRNPLLKEEMELRLKVISTQKMLEEATMEWKAMEQKMKVALELHTARLSAFKKELESVRRTEDEIHVAEERATAAVEAVALKEAERRAKVAEDKLSAQQEATRAAREVAEIAKQRQAEAELTAEKMKAKLQEASVCDEDELEQTTSSGSEQCELDSTTSCTASVNVDQEPLSSSIAEGALISAASNKEDKEEIPLLTRRADSSYSVSDFMCTPEQYDGLHLAAKRLRREIATLEKQMEEGDAEDDETLMSVLASSRADLEELEECIGSVQHNADWAEERDAARAQSEKECLTNISPAARQLQDEIDNHNFNLSLLEKRLHVATHRGVINKLEQRIVHARREVARLRREQDHLRRTGKGDEYGVPQSVSIAETLSGEEELVGEPLEEAIPQVKEATSTPTAVETIPEEINAPSLNYEEELEEITGGLFSGEEYPLSSHNESLADGDVEEMGDEEAEKLKMHLDHMVLDIQNLQNTISGKEGETDEETNTILNDLREKLHQLLQIRNEVEIRLGKIRNGNTEKTNSASPLTPSSLQLNGLPIAPKTATSYSKSKTGRRSGVLTKKRSVAQSR